MQYDAAAICSRLHLRLQAQEAQARAEQQVSKLQDHVKSAEQQVKRLEQQLAGSQAAAAQKEQELATQVHSGNVHTCLSCALN
jgi:septal ring factor EnvC (AmiA/AmiB activator)